MVHSEARGTMALFIFTLVVLLPAAWGSGLHSAVAIDNLGIYGGRNISIEEAPFVVAVMLVNNATSMIQRCTGSIIHKNFILTAAHCAWFVKIEKLSVIVGSDRLLANGKEYEVVKKFCHENYTDYNEQGYLFLDNDICLLKLRTSLEFDNTVAKVELPGENFEIEADTLVNVTGFGITQNLTDVLPLLRQVTIPIVSKEVCRKHHVHPKYVDDRMICAGLKGHNACNGDSGGPLTYNNTVIIGVTFAGSENCSFGDTTIFVRVSSYLQWINNTITENL